MDLSVSKRSKLRHKNRSASLARVSQNLPPSGSANASRGMISAAFSAEMRSYSGPIPPPDLLKQYDEISPGTALRIIAMSEKQSEHRMSLEKKVVESGITRSTAGLVCGFLIACVFAGAGVWVASMGHPAAGATIATASVVGLVGVFVTGTLSQRSERNEKAKVMVGKK
ncbi:MAG: hypothetical protein FD138_2918 [Planctomycetota bacterium]|nr:MAG: hypothetical protein FD138_2918 [Planctomycetota bacterium]